MPFSRRAARRGRLLAALLPLPLALAACGSGGGSASISGVVSVANLPHFHYAGVHLTYSHLPPLGGAHSPYWLACGVYATAVPSENAVHDLEHGAVWITYKPDLPSDQVDTLQQLDSISSEYVLISPYDGLQHAVTVTAWGLQLTAESASDPRISAFVKKYAGGGQGGEQGATCKTRGVTPAQASQLFQQGPPAGQPAPVVPADAPVAPSATSNVPPSSGAAPSSTAAVTPRPSAS